MRGWRGALEDRRPAPSSGVAASVQLMDDRPARYAGGRHRSRKRIIGAAVRELGNVLRNCKQDCLVQHMNFNGMWLGTSDDPREALSPGKGEKAVLAEYLDRYRITFELKCEELTPEQLALRSVPPSTMSLLGMVRHLARVEHSWTRRVLEGQAELPRLYRTAEDPDLDFNQAAAEDAVVADAWTRWRGEVSHAQEV